LVSQMMKISIVWLDMCIEYDANPVVAHIATGKQKGRTER
jgi:hypothetical protein